MYVLNFIHYMTLNYTNNPKLKAYSTTMDHIWIINLHKSCMAHKTKLEAKFHSCMTTKLHESMFCIAHRPKFKKIVFIHRSCTTSVQLYILGPQLHGNIAANLELSREM